MILVSNYKKTILIIQIDYYPKNKLKIMGTYVLGRKLYNYYE